ncbi:MAG: hypothetical protein H7066_02350 [Cytophagaceae bacterium]|nr:hypothetical protein [Gemmatimonadaceae bacterium]
MTRALTLAALMASCTLSTASGAQVARTGFDTAQVRTFTVAALLRSARTEVEISRLATSNPTVAAMVDRLVSRLDRPAVSALPLQVVAEAQQRTGANRQAGFGRIARWQRKPEVPGLGDGDAAALDTLTRLMPAELRTALEGTRAVSDDSVDRILAPLDALNFARRNISIGQSLEKLNRFERKYGPDAPQLNGVEVGLNYVAQWIPLFLPNSEGWPSRFEIVGAYVPAYLTMVDSKARAVTVAEVGLRSYIWRAGWGGKEGGVLRPGYLSFGVAVAGAQDGAFVSPLQGESRIGAFLGWGEAKVAFLGGDRKRVLVTRQFQAIPWVF